MMAINGAILLWLFPLLAIVQGQDCSTPVAPSIGSECEYSGGQCIKTDCSHVVNCNFEYIEGKCGIYDSQGYKCCPYESPFPAICYFVGDPHIATLDGNKYDNHQPGDYFAARACGWKWYLKARFDDPFSQGWTVYQNVELGFGTFRPIPIPSQKIFTVDRNRYISYQYQQLTGVVNVKSVAGEVIVIINNVHEPLSPVEIWTTFGLKIHIYPDPWPMLYIFVEKRWLNQMCGLCGPFDLNWTNDLDYQYTSSANLRGRRDTVRQERETGACSAEVQAEAQTYCQAQLSIDSGNCPSVNVKNFEDFCISDYCIGGAANANYSLTSFKASCNPPKTATCSMCGFRQIQTFDGSTFYYLGSECDYEFAKDCSGDDVWSISIALKNQNLGGQKELLLSRVKITYNGRTIVFIRSGQTVKVDGVDVTGSFTSPDADFVLVFVGNMVEFMAVDLVVAYNFKQMLKVDVREKYLGKTCGICGNFNEDENDDLTTGDSYQLLGECDAGVGATPCSTTAEYDAALELCEEALQAVDCGDININEHLTRCANEVCVGGSKILCQHILEYMDKCYWKTRDPTVLDYEIDSCKLCFPRAHSGTGNKTGARAPSDCGLMNGKCLDTRCEVCKHGFIDGKCTGDIRKCCINP